MINPEDFVNSGSLDSQFAPTQEPQDPQPTLSGLGAGLPKQQDPVKPYESGLVSARQTENAIIAQNNFADTVVRNLRDARNIDPEDYVNAERMAKGLNISVDEVFKDKQLAVQLYREKQDRRSQFWDTAPELAKLLEESAFAAKAQRAIDQYSYLERTALAWEHGGLTTRRGELGLKSLNKTLTSEEQADLDELEERMSVLPAPAGEILPEAARIFGMQAEMSPATVGSGLVGAVVGGTAGFFAGGGVGAAPGAAKGYFLASTAASAYKMYEIEAGNAYLDMVDQGVDPIQAAEKSKTIGIFNAAIELALAPIAGSGFRRMVNNQIVRKFATDEAADETARFLLLGRGFKSPVAQGAFDYAKALIAEPVEEGVQELVNEYGTRAAILASRPEYRALMEGMGNTEQESHAAEAFANAFWGMVAGGLVQGGSGYFATSGGAARQAEIAKNNGEALKHFIDIAAESKADPSVTKKLVTRLTDKHGNGDLSISSTDLLGVLDKMASKASEGRATPLTRDDMLKALRSADPDMGNQLDDIITSGTDGEVFVKTADFVTKYVDKPTSEFYRELVSHVRVIQGDATVPLSLQEAQTLLSRIEELRRKEIEIIEKKERPFRDAAHGVRKQLTELFDKNTAMNKDEKKAATELLWLLAMRNAREGGTLPEMKFAGMPLLAEQVGVGMTAKQFDDLIGTEDTLKVFAGEKAVTAQLGRLEEAKRLIAEGSPKKAESWTDVDQTTWAEEVRRKTGWFQGSEGKWRFEISDEDKLPGMKYGLSLKIISREMINEKAAKFAEMAAQAQGIVQPAIKEFNKSDKGKEAKAKLEDAFKRAGELNSIAKLHHSPNIVQILADHVRKGNKSIKLGDLIDHKELFAAYPRLKNIVVSTPDYFDFGRAVAFAGDNEIGINPNAELTLDEFLEVVMHEIQHHIQDKEGMDAGTNPAYAGGFAEYWNTPGEIEAREVQGRRVFTKAQRETTPVLGTAALLSSTPTPAGLEATAAYITNLNKIILNKNATLKDVVHEIGHMVLEDVIFRANAAIASSKTGAKFSQQDIDIANDILEWFGVTGGTAVNRIANWANLTPEMKTKMHERLAYNYEDYVKTHTAPTERIRKLFQKISEIIRGFWRNVKDEPASVYKRIFNEDLPILSSQAAHALDLKLSMAHEIENNDVVAALSEVGLTKEEALEAGFTDDEWVALQQSKNNAIDSLIDYAVSKQYGNAAWYAKKFRAAHEKYQRFINKVRQRIFGEEKDKLIKIGVYNLRNWMETGVMHDANGNKVAAVPDQVTKLSRADVKLAHDQMVKNLSGEVRQVEARLKTLDRVYNAAEFERLTEYVKLIKSVIRINTTTALLTANKVFRLSRDAFRDSTKTIEQFKKELMDGLVSTALRTVRRSGLYVFKDIRSLVRAADDAKLDAQEVEDLIVQLLTEGKELNGFRASSKLVAGTARRADREVKLGFARTAKDLLNALRIEFTLEAIEGTKSEQTKKIQAEIDGLEKKLATLRARHGEAKKKVKGTDTRNAKKIESEMKAIQTQITKTRERWNDLTTEIMNDSGKPKSQRQRKGSDVPGLPAEIAKMVDDLWALRDEHDKLTRTETTHSPMSEEVYNKILDLQIKLNKALAKEATGRLNKEMISRIEADAVEQVEVNYPEFHGKLKASEVTAGVMDAVNRRIARHLMSRFMDGMFADGGVSVAGYQKSKAKRTGDAKSFVLALIMAQQKGNSEEDVALARAESQLNNEFGKAATRMHVDAGAKELLKEAVEEEAVLSAYSDYVDDKGMPLDLVSNMFGFKSVDDMLLQLLTSQDVNDAALENADRAIQSTPEFSNRAEIDRIVGESLANDMRVDILREEIRAVQTALQRVYEAGLSPEEKAKREAKRTAAQNRIDVLRSDRDALKARQQAVKAQGDTKTSDVMIAQIKAMNAEIRKLSVIAGAPLVTAQEVREGAEYLARERMSGKLVGEIKPALFLIASRRAAKRAMSAMKRASSAKGKDDYLVEYIEAKMDELANEMMWREAIKAQSQISKNEEFIKKIFGDKKEIGAERDFEVVLAARAIAVIYGFRKGDVDEAVKAVDSIQDPGLRDYLVKLISVSMFEASDASLRAMSNHVVQAYEEEADTKTLPPIYKDLTWDQYSKLMTNMRHLWEKAKLLKEIEKRERDRLDEMRKLGALKTMTDTLDKWDKLTDKLSKLPLVGKWFAPKGSDRAGKPGIFSRNVDEVLVKNMKMESFFLEIDGDQPGFFTRNVWRRISNASVARELQLAVYLKRYVDLIAPFKDRLNEAIEIEAPELADADGNDHVFGANGGRGFSELFWLLAHLGNRHNYSCMLVGMGFGTITDGVLDDSKWVKFYARAINDGLITDEMLEVMQSVGDMFNELKPAYRRTYLLANNVPITDVEPTEVQGKAKKFKGWYMPAQAAPTVVEERRTGDELADALTALQENVTGPVAPFLPSNRGRDRNENYQQFARQLRADHTFIPQAMEQVIRFIHMYEPINEAVKLFSSPEVASLLNRYKTGVVKNGITPWLRDIASRSSGTSRGDNAELMKKIRTTMVGVQMFANVKVSAENFTGLIIAMLEVDPKHMARAIATVTRHPIDIKEQIASKSKFMGIYHRDAAMELAMEIVEFVKGGGKLENVQEWMRKNSSLMVKQTQVAVSDMVWIAKYNQVMAGGSAGNITELEAEAIEQADSAVRLTQNSFRIEDKTVYERGSEFTKWVFTYSGWFNMVRQLYSRKTKSALLNESLGAATAKAGFYFLAAYTIPSLISAYLAAILYDKLDDDDEDKYDELVSEMVWGAQLRTVVSGFPPIGNIAMSIIDAELGKSFGRGPGDNAILGGIYRQAQSLFKLVSLPVSEKDWTGRDTKNLLDAMSGALGIPSIGRPVGYIQAASTGEAEPDGILDFIRGLTTGTYQK